MSRNVSHAIFQVVICQLLTAQVWVRSQYNSCEISDRQSGTRTCFILSTGLGGFISDLQSSTENEAVVYYELRLEIISP